MTVRILKLTVQRHQMTEAKESKADYIKRCLSDGESPATIGVPETSISFGIGFAIGIHHLQRRCFEADIS
jgi:hypothetical protein